MWGDANNFGEFRFSNTIGFGSGMSELDQALKDSQQAQRQAMRDIQQEHKQLMQDVAQQHTQILHDISMPPLCFDGNLGPHSLATHRPAFGTASNMFGRANHAASARFSATNDANRLNLQALRESLRDTEAQLAAQARSYYNTVRSTALPIRNRTRISNNPPRRQARRLSESPSPRQVAPTPPEASKPEDKLSKPVQNYQATFVGKQSFQARFAQLEAQAASLNKSISLPEEYSDPISLEIMNQPVMVHGSAFDLSSIVDWLETRGGKSAPHPIKGGDDYRFSYLHIQQHDSMRTKIDAWLTKQEKTLTSTSKAAPKPKPS